MSTICLIDTAVFVEILRVPGMDSHHADVVAELGDRLTREESLFLPMATILETGNHIGQNGDGRERRACAQRFGEEPYEIVVRWKPLEEQPIGWHPDINDGVRVNIRPFLSVPDVKRRGAGVLVHKPNIHWKKDRGKGVESAPWYNLGPQLGGAKGDRINDYHLILAAKQQARAQATKESGNDQILDY